MSNRMWDNTVEHAKTCVLGGKIYIYYIDATQTTGVVFSDIYELMGLIAAGQFFCVESLSPDQKVLVDMLVKRAYDDWNHVVEYDSKVLQSSINQTSPPIMDYDTPSEHYFMPMKQNQDSSTGSSYVEAESSSTQLALETSPSSSYAATYPSRSEDYLDEEEIRIRSTEMLEHDDMQHLLRSFTVLVGSNASEPCYSYTIAPPLEPRVQEHNNRVNAKASISWVKLKAAFRWGIFTRKRAAERRAQLV